MKKTVLIFILGTLNTVSWYAVISWWNFQPSVSFLNVGQGDAILIKDRSGNILVDAGRKNGLAAAELHRILPFYRRTVDIGIITHADTDHYAGFLDIVNMRPPKLFLFNGKESPSATFDALKAMLQEKRIPLVRISRGNTLLLQDSKISVLHPAAERIEPLSDNDASLVLRVSQNGAVFLLTADVGIKIERLLITEHSDLAADVLQAGHHGSKYSTGADFLKAVRPAAAVISVGKNPYGHPAKETLDRLSIAGIPFLRTDQDGTIEFMGRRVKFYK